MLQGMRSAGRCCALAQESRFWLRTIRDSDLLVDKEVDALIQESDELVRIINTIVALTAKRMSENGA
jgi:hypothetical protein